MQFELHKAIWFFWSIPVLLLVFLFVEKRRKTLLSRFLSPEVLPIKLPEYAPWYNGLQTLFFLVALAFLGIALLKPYNGFEMREIKRKGIDVFFLVDLSPSMLAEDIKPNRIQRAKYEIKDFLARLKGDRVGLIGFSGMAVVLVPLTGDYDVFDLYLNELDPDLIPSPGTNINEALKLAAHSFSEESQSQSKAVVLITDGEDEVALDDDVVDEIKKQNARVYIYGMGTPEGAPIPLPEGGYKTDGGEIVISKLNEEALQQLALNTQGAYARSVSGDADLQQIYDQGIKKDFQQVELASTMKKMPHYHFQWAILVALIFLILETATTKKRSFLTKWMVWRKS